MIPTEKELIKNLKCDELCALQSFKTNPQGKKSINKKINDKQCSCW